MGTKDTQRANAADSSRLENSAQAADCCRSRWRWYATLGLVAAVAIVAWIQSGKVDPDAERRQGAAYVTLGRIPDAIGCFERALAVRDDALTRRLLADALKSVGRNDDAAREYKRALTLAPRDAATWLNFGNLQRTEFHDKRGALEAYRQASEADPTMGEAQYGVGAMLMELGDYDAAVAALQAGIQVAKPGATWKVDAETMLDIARLRAVEAKGVLKPPRQ